MTVLLPCPFCGKTPVASGLRIVCMNHRCDVRPATDSLDHKRRVCAWNTRKKPVEHPKETLHWWRTRVGDHRASTGTPGERYRIVSANGGFALYWQTERVETYEGWFQRLYKAKIEAAALLNKNWKPRYGCQCRYCEAGRAEIARKKKKKKP